jgi:hypothetical protein
VVARNDDTMSGASKARKQGASVATSSCLQLIAAYKATFFINHDKSQTDKLKLLPASYD